MIEGRDTLSRNCRLDTRLAILGFPLLLAACGEVTDIHIDDDDVFAPLDQKSAEHGSNESGTSRYHD